MRPLRALEPLSCRSGDEEEAQKASEDSSPFVFNFEALVESVPFSTVFRSSLLPLNSSPFQLLCRSNTCMRVCAFSFYLISQISYVVLDILLLRSFQIL